MATSAQIGPIGAGGSGGSHQSSRSSSPTRSTPRSSHDSVKSSPAVSSACSSACSQPNLLPCSPRAIRLSSPATPDIATLAYDVRSRRPQLPFGGGRPLPFSCSHSLPSLCTWHHRPVPCISRAHRLRCRYLLVRASRNLIPATPYPKWLWKGRPGRSATSRPRPG